MSHADHRIGLGRISVSSLFSLNDMKKQMAPEADLQTPESCGSKLRLLNVIVRSLARDDDVVDVAFAQSGIRDAHKAGFCLQVLDRSTAQIAHAGTQSADELVDHCFKRSAMGHAAFNAFRNELGQTILTIAFAGNDAFCASWRILKITAALEVALARALRHGDRKSTRLNSSH